MSDPTDTPHRTPLSSSSATVGGTSALRVKVDTGAPEPEKTPHPAAATQPDEAPVQPAPEQPSIPDLAAEAAEAMSAHLEATQDMLEELAPAFEPKMPAEADAAAPEAVIQPDEAIDHAVTQSIEAGAKAQAKAASIFDHVSQSFKAAMTDAGSDAALITFTLLEFARANARNNFQLAQDYAGARSVPEIVNVQAAYFKRQVELMNRHSSELRKVAAEITSKKAAQIQASVARP